MADSLFEPERLDLAEVINGLLDKGVVLRGEAIISVADIDLINLDLGIMLVAMETLTRTARSRGRLVSALGAPALTPGGSGLVSAPADEATPAHGDALLDSRPREARSERVTKGSEAGTPEASLRSLAPALPERINVDPEHVENGLARLALTLIEVLRKVLEHQAIRRMEGGSLEAEEVERLGLALLRLHDRMQELKGIFGLSDGDLEIDLGPLGRVR